jgi:predicted nucleotidyltransferase component of viral defense system
LPDQALVEKDWFVAKALAAIAAAAPGPFRLVFQGGTSLSRAHRVIARMSEDIDIKIMSQGPPCLRESITGELCKAGFKFDPKNPEHLQPNYPATHTVGCLTRRSLQDKARCGRRFRPKLRPLRRRPIERPVTSFVVEAFKRPPELTIACTAIVETAAEKLVALTRRAGAELAGAQRRDPTLVRHL